MGGGLVPRLSSRMGRKTEGNHHRLLDVLHLLGGDSPTVGTEPIGRHRSDLLAQSRALAAQAADGDVGGQVPLGLRGEIHNTVPLY